MKHGACHVATTPCCVGCSREVGCQRGKARSAQPRSSASTAALRRCRGTLCSSPPPPPHRPPHTHSRQTRAVDAGMESQVPTSAPRGLYEGSAQNTQRAPTGSIGSEHPEPRTPAPPTAGCTARCLAQRRPRRRKAPGARQPHAGRPTWCYRCPAGTPPGLRQREPVPRSQFKPSAMAHGCVQGDPRSQGDTAPHGTALPPSSMQRCAALVQLGACAGLRHRVAAYNATRTGVVLHLAQHGGGDDGLEAHGLAHLNHLEGPPGGRNMCRPRAHTISTACTQPGSATRKRAACMRTDGAPGNIAQRVQIARQRTPPRDGATVATTPYHPPTKLAPHVAPMDGRSYTGPRQFWQPPRNGPHHTRGTRTRAYIDGYATRKRKQ
jgi:hypothetical protein